MIHPLVYDLTPSDLTALLQTWGESGFRAKQIWTGLYKNFWEAPDQFSNLPLALRAKLAEELRFDALTPTLELNSSDGQTRKTLFQLADGKQIEAVLMTYEERRTLCISTQVGCAMGCTFCATGQMGFGRHLSSGEIVAQVLYYARLLRAENEHVTNVVVMGMGEPFHNYDNTMAAIDRLNDAEGYNFGARRFTVSTVGIIPMIRRFADEKRQVNLAVSLHAADDALRVSMLPINRRYPLDELLDACRDYVEATGRRITFEWALINGVNDTPDQAEKLAKRLKGLLCHVNAIPLNPIPPHSPHFACASPAPDAGRCTAGTGGVQNGGTQGGYQATTRERASAFKQVLDRHGIPCTIRTRRGIDIQAGCGQLASQKVTVT